METFIQILGYGFVGAVLVGILYMFVRLLTSGLDALTKNDD